MIVEPGEFYSDAEPALQQGDIVLAPVGRLESLLADRRTASQP
jgi:hypothetical protein